jgi:hypothetical protein
MQVAEVVLILRQATEPVELAERVVVEMQVIHLALEVPTQVVVEAALADNQEVPLERAVLAS